MNPFTSVRRYFRNKRFQRDLRQLEKALRVHSETALKPLAAVPVTDLTEATQKLLTAPLRYETSTALHYPDPKTGQLTPAVAIVTKQSKATHTLDRALAEHAAQLDLLNAEEPIFAVLGGLTNSIEIDDDTILLASYIYRSGKFGAEAELQHKGYL